MDEQEVLRALLSPMGVGPRWHLDYGLTAARRVALTRGAKDGNSLLHPASETALTLQILGMLDGWSQVGAFVTTPRTDRDAWDGTFFSNLRTGAENYAGTRAGSKTARSGWNALGVFWDGPLDLEEAVLLFEFDRSATEFHPAGSRLKFPSFLKLPNDDGWATFDAVLIVPPDEASCAVRDPPVRSDGPAPQCRPRSRRP